MNSTLSAKNAEEIYHHTAIFVVHCFVAVLNLMGIFTTAQVTGLFIRYKVFHVNLRILFTNLAAQLILRALCTTFRSSKFIYNSLTVKNFSTVVETERECATKAALFASFHETSIFSFVALSIERVWATVKYEKYERQSGWYFRVFLVIASWIRVYYTVYYIATYDFGLEENVPYCISINSKGIGWDFLCYCFLPLTLISGVMFTFVYLRSKTTNRYIPRSLEILFLFQETHPPQPHSQLSVPTHGEHPDLASRCSLRHHLRHPCSHQRQLLRGSPKIQRPLLPAQPHLSERAGQRCRLPSLPEHLPYDLHCSEPFDPETVQVLYDHQRAALRRRPPRGSRAVHPTLATILGETRSPLGENLLHQKNALVSPLFKLSSTAFFKFNAQNNRFIFTGAQHSM